MAKACLLPLRLGQRDRIAHRNVGLISLTRHIIFAGFL